MSEHVNSNLMRRSKMAAIPIVQNVMIYPKNKTDAPYPATIAGWAFTPGVGVGGGPILPPDHVPPDEVKPPLVIWGGPFDPPHVDNTLPEPPTPPEKPPESPTPPHEGWNWSVKASGWYYLYVPGEGSAGPKTGTADHHPRHK
jgi:hypothetical protein